MALAAGLGAGYAALTLLFIWAFLEHPACKAGGGGGHAPGGLWPVREAAADRGAVSGPLLRLWGLLLLVSLARETPVMAGGLLGPSLGMRGILIAAALCYGALSLVLGRQFTHTRTRGELQELTLTRQGRSVKLLALRDTGNTLQDPLTGRPVVVVEGEKLRPLLPELPRLDRQSLTHPVELLRDLEGTAGDLRLQLLPYRAVGGGVRPAPGPAGGPGQLRRRGSRDCLTALSPTPLSDGGGTAPSSAARGREHTMTGGMGMKKPWARWRWALGGWLARLRLWQPGKLMYIGGSDVLPAP